MSLKGKVSFIAGGTGIVGSGIAQALLKAGSKVYIASRDLNRLQDLKNSFPAEIRDNLELVQGEVSSESDCIRIRDYILGREKQINHVVSSLGGWWMKGTLSEQSLEEYNKVFNDMVTSHFVVYKTFAKHLSQNPGSTYTFISGGSGEQSESGIIFEPKASLINVGSSSVYGLYNAASAEFNNHPNLSINQLRIFIWVKNQPDSTFNPDTDTHLVGNDYIGKIALKIIEKHRAGTFRVKSRAEGLQEYEKI